MNKSKIKKAIAIALMSTAIIGVFSTGASAAWKKDSSGWWYTEGSSWATGWRNIDGNWYYFNSNGYMAHDTTIYGYYLNSNGACTNSIITLEEAKQTALNKVKAVRYPNGTVNFKVIIISLDISEEVIEGRSGYLIPVGENHPDHTVTTTRVFIDKHTGEIFDAFDVLFLNGKLKEFK